MKTSTQHAVLIWIAVAVATAIRLFGGSFSVPAAAAVALLGAAVLIFARASTPRLAGAFLLVAGLTDAAAVWDIRSVARSIPGRLTVHSASSIGVVRHRIAAIERTLDANAAAIANRIGKAATPPARATLFQVLCNEARQPGRGARIVDAQGQVLAWCGEELRATADKAFQFDATNLYVVKNRQAGSVRIESFARIANLSDAKSPFQKADRWVISTVFHGGFLRQEPGSQRFLIAQRGDSRLFVDVIPRAPAEVLELRRREWRNARAILAALFALVMLAVMRGRMAVTPSESEGPGVGATRSGSPIPPPSRPLAPARGDSPPAVAFLVTVAIITIARAALLEIRPTHDSLRIFGFEVYASRFLGALSRSPFDLLLTAVAVAMIAGAAARVAIPVPLAARLALALGAAWGFVQLVENLVANARITPVPDHIVPVSAVQAALLAALLLFALALVALSRHATAPGRTLLVVAISLPVVLAVAGYAGGRRGIAFAVVGGVLLMAFAIHAFTSHDWIRIFAAALLTVPIVYIPLTLFERASARRFVADVYAPLVVGEAGQLRTMIEDTLRSEFSSTDISTILPDDYRHMNLDDLAYALWLRSDLSKWRVPAVITIRDDFTARPISRFGVGLPQFTERASAAGREVLQVGSLTRVLIHHDFDVTALGITVAHGSVHVVNPADPGATAFADVYRDFFEADSGDAPGGIYPQREPEPVVYDREGNVHGTQSFRLPQSPSWYFERFKTGSGAWIDTAGGDVPKVYLRRAENALYAFPLDVATPAEQVRRAGSVAIWSIAAALALVVWRSMPALIALARRAPRGLDFRARTALYLIAVVILPLMIFVLFVRAYLANRLATEYVDRGQTALNAAQRVIEDYLASGNAAPPEQVLDDEILSWLARVIGHDLHLYRDSQLVASSRRDLFAAHVESERLPGDVYSAIVLGGKQLVRVERAAGATQYVEIYSPVRLMAGRDYTLALPFIVQGRQIEAEVNDLATTIYMLLVFIILASIAVAFRIARSVTRPVQGLVGGARAVAQGDFDVNLRVPSDPDLGLLVTTFRDMAHSIRRQQDDLRHERDRLRTLLENINAAVVVLDGAMRVAATNESARRLFGDAAQTSTERFRPPFDELQTFLDQHEPRRVASAEMEMQIDGNSRTFRVSIVPLPDSDEEMLIAEDVTEILRSNRLEAWGEMARQVAHEIKNPLTPIQLTAEHLRALADADDPNLSAVVRAGVDNILRQVVTLRETAKDFGDYASLRQIDRRPMNLRAMLEDIATAYAPSAERGIDFRAEIDPSTPESFTGDARLLRGAIVNLIENAFQAAPRGSVRLISRAVGSRVVISVEDNGPGVAAEMLPRIFEPYFSTKTSGTGLGLAITRKAVEEHAGQIQAENLAPGFRVSIDLPVSTPSS